MFKKNCLNCRGKIKMQSGGKKEVSKTEFDNMVNSGFKLINNNTAVRNREFINNINPASNSLNKGGAEYEQWLINQMQTGKASPEYLASQGYGNLDKLKSMYIPVSDTIQYNQKAPVIAPYGAFDYNSGEVKGMMRNDTLFFKSDVPQSLRDRAAMIYEDVNKRKPVTATKSYFTPNLNKKQSGGEIPDVPEEDPEDYIRTMEAVKKSARNQMQDINDSLSFSKFYRNAIKNGKSGDKVTWRGKQYLLDPLGQWRNPYKKTLVPTEDGRITMKGVPYSVLGIDETGMKQLMKPNRDYKFKGKNVLEIPLFQSAGIVPFNLNSNGFKSAFQIEEQKPILQLDKGVPVESEIGKTKDNTNFSLVDLQTSKNKNHINPALFSFGKAALSAYGTRMQNQRQQNSIEERLYDPFQVIPNVTTNNRFLNEGNAMFQDGGEIEEQEYPEEGDFKFLFDEEENIAPEDYELDGFELKQPIEEEESASQDIITLDDEEGTESVYTPESNNVNNYLTPIVPPIRGSNNIIEASETNESRTNEEYAFNYFVQKGIPQHIAAGIVGNLIQESSLNPNAKGDKINGKYTAYGLAQWRGDRLINLKDKSLNGQLDYIINEAKQRGDLDKLMQTKSPEEAAYVFAKYYERPRNIEEVRKKNAAKIYNKYAR